MATTETILSGDGTTTQFGFTFPYIKTEDVKVELQEFDTVESTVISRVQISSFSIPSNNPTVVDFSAIGAATNYQAITGAPLTNHAVNTSNTIRVRIYRFTSADANPSTFLQGSTIRAQDLNDNFEQILYIMQERQNTIQTIQLGGIGENIIGTVSIQDDAITADKLRDSTVTDSDRAVTTNHIRDNAVTTAKLASDLTVDLASGTVGSPSLTFDENTGLYSPGEDQVALSTGGTGRLFINASGNVGIGTISPSEKLELGSGNIKLANVGRIFSTDGSRGSVQISAPHDATLRRVTYGNNYYLDSDSTYKQGSTAIGGCALELTAPNANYGTLKFIQKQDPDSGGATRDALVINEDGKIGIGTGSPTHLFQAVSSGTSSEAVAAFGNASIANGLQIQTNGNLDWGFNALNSRNLTFSTNQQERLRITSDGKLGLGTATPQSELTVRGSNPQITLEPTSDVTQNCRIQFALADGTVQSQITGGGSLGSVIRFSQGPTERMRIASTGALGLSGANYGNSGQVLTSNGSGSAPSWQTAPTAKAWVHFNGSAATITPADSYNVSSITDRGTGRYTVNLTNTLGSTNPACFASGVADSSRLGNASPDSSDPDDKIAVGFKGTNNQFYDDEKVSVVVFA